MTLSKSEKELGEKWRSRLTLAAKLSVTKSILNIRAIAVFRNRKKESNVFNAAGYFVQVLKQGWKATKVATVSQDDSENTLDTQAVFRLWYDLARELGYCSGQVVQDGEQMVNMNGTWETWESAMKRGYSLDYLKKLLRRQNN